MPEMFWRWMWQTASEKLTKRGFRFYVRWPSLNTDWLAMEAFAISKGGKPMPEIYGKQGVALKEEEKSQIPAHVE